MPARTKEAKRKRPSKLLDWRAKQREGSIMRPSTFKSIEERAEKEGYDDPKAVAGSAYWRTARAKFRKSRRSRSR